MPTEVVHNEVHVDRLAALAEIADVGLKAAAVRGQVDERIGIDVAAAGEDLHELDAAALGAGAGDFAVEHGAGLRALHLHKADGRACADGQLRLDGEVFLRHERFEHGQAAAGLRLDGDFLAAVCARALDGDADGLRRAGERARLRAEVGASSQLSAVSLTRRKFHVREGRRLMVKVFMCSPPFGISRCSPSSRAG